MVEKKPVVKPVSKPKVVATKKADVKEQAPRERSQRSRPAKTEPVTTSAKSVRPSRNITEV